LKKTRKIQDDHIQILKREDGTTKNIYLLDKKNIHNNRLQVINQYEEAGGKHETRYDVTILVNGLPLVHVELKRRGVAIREAFNQIKRYQRDSFWAASGLFEYVQIFVISNGTHTKYYSNTTRNAHIKEQSSLVNVEKVRKQATVLSLQAFGQMLTTKLFLTLWILLKHFLPNTPS
jgi:type I restriction enzyme R subunit